MILKVYASAILLLTQVQHTWLLFPNHVSWIFIRYWGQINDDILEQQKRSGRPRFDLLIVKESSDDQQWMKGLYSFNIKFHHFI